MKLSKKSEYACLALIDLSKHYNQDLTTIGELARRNEIPKKYLEQILLVLKGAGYVRSIRGHGGGYELAKAPKAISVAEIVRLIDGPLAPVGSVSTFFYQPSPAENNDQLLALFKDIRDMVSTKLEEATFDTLIMEE